MTVHAKQVVLLTVPVSGPLAMDAHFPVAENRAVTLSAKAIRFCELDQGTVRQVQEISLLSVMAVQAPAIRLVMVQFDRIMLDGQFMWFPIHFIIRIVAVAAGKNILAERRRRDRNFSFHLRSPMRLRAANGLKGCASFGGMPRPVRHQACPKIECGEGNPSHDCDDNKTESKLIHTRLQSRGFAVGNYAHGF